MAGKIHRNSLKPGHKILWYEIKEVLGQGGFGITYLAYDPNLEKLVAIKEYLPIELAVREGDFSVHPVTEDRGKQYQWGLDRFITEARTLAKFKHPNIVHVFSVTEENNTAYMVMEYEQGQSLQEKLKGGKTLEEAELLKLLIPISGGLEIVHKLGFIHRDIKPDNIIIRNDGSPVLIDFGSARQALGEQTKTLTSLISPGYAPFEQYFSKGDEQGEWTDIYGLGATLYRAIAGVAPLDAVDRSNSILKTSKDTIVSAVKIGKGKYSERFLKAIDHAIQFRQEDRPQTIAEWKAEFELPDDPIKEAEVIEQQATQPGKTVITRQQETKSKSIKIIALVTLLLSITFALYFLGSTLVSDWQQEKEEQRLYVLDQKRLEQEEAQRLAEEKRIVEEKKRLEEEARLKQQQHIADLFIKAEKTMTQNRLVEPVGNNALDIYLQILKLEPDNDEAIAGKSQVFKILLSNVEDLIEANKFDAADHSLTQANAIEPDSVETRLIRVRLNDAKKEAERIALEEKQRLEEEEKQRLVEEQKRIKEKETERLAEVEKQHQEEIRLEEERNRIEEAKLAEDRVEHQKQEEEARRLAAKEAVTTSVTVIFFRKPAFIGSGLNIHITYRGTKIASLPIGSSFTYSITPGKHTFDTSLYYGGVRENTFEFEPRQTYYIMTVIEKRGIGPSGASLRLVTEAEGRAVISEQKKIKDNRNSEFRL